MMRIKNIIITSFSYGIVSIAFFITRAPFFIYYPVVSITPDYGSYYVILHQMASGTWPIFDVRTPGFPLFMKAVFLFTDKLLNLIIAQNVITLLSAFFLIYCVFKTYRMLAPFVAIGIAGFISSVLHVESDTTALSESIYVNLSILTFAFMILAVHSKKPLYFVLSSLAMAYAIWTRPSAIFFAIIFVLALIFFIVNRYGAKNILSYTVPFVSLIGALCFYNLAVIHSFSLTTFGDAAMVLTTSTFLEEDPQNAPELNAAIRKIQDRVSDYDKNALRHSWDLLELNRIFNTCPYWDNSSVYGPLSVVTNQLSPAERSALYKKLYRTAIYKNPAIYFKLFLTNSIRYFIVYSAYDFDFYPALAGRYKQLFIDKNYAQNNSEDIRKDMLKEYYDPAPLPYFRVISESGGDRVECVPTFLQKLHRFYQARIQMPLFRNTFWALSMFLVFLLSLISLLRSKLSSKGAFILFIMTAAAIGSGLITSLGTCTVIRYSYTMEFVYYVAFAMLPVLLYEKKLESYGKDEA